MADDPEAPVAAAGDLGTCHGPGIPEIVFYA